LEARIANYEDAWAQATSDERRASLEATITASRETLNRHIDEKRAIEEANRGDTSTANATTDSHLLDTLIAIQAEQGQIRSLLLARRRIRTLQRGSSHVPTPEDATPLPPVTGFPMRTMMSEANRYGRLFRAHACHFNSDINVVWTRVCFSVKYKGNDVFRCPSYPKDIKNAYALLRLVDCNINDFLGFLSENNEVVPNVFEDPTPPRLSDVSVEDV
jgi:hypothetical protein